MGCGSSGNKTAALDAERIDAAGDTKPFIAEPTVSMRTNSLPMDEQRFALDRQLGDSRTLSDHNLQNSSTIHLMQRVRSGMRAFALALTGQAVPDTPNSQEGPSPDSSDVPEREPGFLQRASSVVFKPMRTDSTLGTPSATLSPCRAPSFMWGSWTGTSSMLSYDHMDDCSGPSLMKVESRSSCRTRARVRTTGSPLSGLLPGLQDKDLEHMGWRARAAITVPPRHSKVDMEKLNKLVQDYLSKEDTPQQQTEFTKWDLPSVTQADSELEKFVRMTLEKVKGINALQGPRMKIVWWGTLQYLGRIPRYPEDHKYILDAEAFLEEWLVECDKFGKVECDDMDGDRQMRGFCLAMFSHRWSRSNIEPHRAFPDTVDNKKCKALEYFGKSGLCHVLHAHELDYYYWIDYSGINQSEYDEKMRGIAMLPAYISCAIKLIYYNAPDYETRAWTRLERILAYAYVWAPLWVYMDDNYPEQPADLKRLAEEKPYLYEHKLDGDSEALSMKILDPCAEDADITDPRDRDYIKRMVGMVEKTKAINPVFKEGGALVLKETCMLIDVLHGQLDAEKLRERAKRVHSLRSQEQNAEQSSEEQKREVRRSMAERGFAFQQQLKDLATEQRRSHGPSEAVIEI